MIGWVSVVTARADDLGVQHLSSGLHEDVVNLVAGHYSVLETAERSTLALLWMTNTKRIEKRRAGRRRQTAGQRLHRGVRLSDIEVASDDDRLVGKLSGLDPLSQQLRASFARRLRLVIQVHVEMPEPTAVAIYESRPGANARNRVAP